jgi:hypothetical protein
MTRPEIQTGIITGRVTNATTGAPVDGAQITSSNTETDQTEVAVTNSLGVYGFAALPVGVYILTATKDGFQSSERADIRVLDSDILHIDFPLNA